MKQWLSMMEDTKINNTCLKNPSNIIYGFKIFIVCDSKTSFVLNCEPFISKKLNNQSKSIPKDKIPTLFSSLNLRMTDYFQN